ncbi:hypothetical protein LM859_000219 [Serratia marcescens]
MSLTVLFLQGVAALTTIANNSKTLLQKKQANPNLSPAINALTKAVHETEMYFRDRGRGKERDTLREDELSRLWTAAAEPVRLVDAQLSELCRYKASYWLFPERYSRGEVVDLQITLEGMNANLQKLRDV